MANNLDWKHVLRQGSENPRDRISSLMLKQTISAPLSSYVHRHREKRLIRNLRHTDVFLVGHPKSGNTWLAYMLAIAIYRGNKDEITMANLSRYIPFIHGNDDDIGLYSRLSDPRVFRNEWPIFPEHYPRTIYMIRNPMSTLVSYYHHYRTVSSATIDIDGFVTRYIEEESIRDFEPKLERWDRQVSSWLERAEYDKSIMTVRYEEMVHDRGSVVRDVVDFARLPCSESDIITAVARGSYDAMRADEELHGAESYPGDIGRRGRFVRSGRVDGWKDELDEDTVAKIEKAFGSTMKMAGYLK